MEDLENHIPIYNLAINDRKSEVTIVKKSTNDGLAFTTEYKKVKIKIDVPSGVVVPSVNNRNDIDYICLTVADLLSVYRERHFLKKYELLSLKVFCYGRLVLKQFRTLPSGNSCLTFILNDGTQEITAKYTSSLERNKTS